MSIMRRRQERTEADENNEDGGDDNEPAEAENEAPIYAEGGNENVVFKAGV